MPLPVYELAAQEIATRLATCTVANGYTFEALSVVRQGPDPIDYGPGTVELMVGALELEQTEAGAFDLADFRVGLSVLVVVEQVSGVPNDSTIAQAVRDLVKALRLSDGTLWIDGRVTGIDHLDAAAGEHAGAVIAVELLIRSATESLDQGL